MVSRPPWTADHGGVIAGSVATNTVQGTIQSTTVATNMAINGGGFFVVAQPTEHSDNQPTFSGVNDYTRAGDFQMNNSGYLVNGAGYYLMGIPVIRRPEIPRAACRRSCNSTTTSCRRKRRPRSTTRPTCRARPRSGEISPSGYADNPVAGAEIIGTGAAISPDAVATGTGTVSNLTNTTLSSTRIYPPATRLPLVTATNTTTYTSTGSDTVGDLIDAINGGASGNATVTAV